METLRCQNCSDYHRLLRDIRVGALHVGQVIFDAQGKPKDYVILDVNVVFAGLLGRPREDIVGKRGSEVFSAFDPDVVERYLEFIANEKIPRFEVRSTTLDRWYAVVKARLGTEGKLIIAAVDITERKEMERQIQKRKDLFRAVNDNSLDSFSILAPICDAEGNIVDFTLVYQNKAAQERMDFTETAIGRPVSQVAPSSWVSHVLAIYKEVMETGQAIELEDREFHTNSDVWYRIVATPVPGGLAIAAQDITERKLAEEVLRSNARRQEYLLNLSDILRSLGDKDAIRQASTGLLKRYLDVPRAIYCDHLEDADFHHATQVGDTFSVTDSSEMMAILRSGRNVTYSDLSVATQTLLASMNIGAILSVPIFKDGSLVASLTVTNRTPRDWSESEVEVVQGTAERTWTAMERARVEKALRESEARYRQLFKTSHDGFWWSDQDGYVTEANTGVAELLGYPLDELVGQCWETFVDEEWHETALQKRADRKRGRPNRYEVKLKKKDGSPVWAYLSGTPLIDEGGKYAGSLVAFADITEQKRAQEELEESQREALELVNALRRADENKNKFISILSHELRNPIATISSGVALLELTVKEQRSLRTIEILKRQIEHLSRLTDGLLDITRISENKMRLCRERVQLNKIVADTICDMEPQFREKGILLKTKICIEPVFVKADALRITQCIVNVLGNALKYVCEQGTVCVTLQTQNDLAVITIEDNGVGMSTEVLAQVFEPFAQGLTTSDDPHNRGLGLGLTIVKGIVEMHGGDVSASSPGPGQGSSVMMRLPIDLE